MAIATKEPDLTITALTNDEKRAAYLKSKGWERMLLHEAPNPLCRWLDPTKPKKDVYSKRTRTINGKLISPGDWKTGLAPTWERMDIEQTHLTPAQYPMTLEDAYDVQKERDEAV